MERRVDYRAVSWGATGLPGRPHTQGAPTMRCECTTTPTSSSVRWYGVVTLLAAAVLTATQAQDTQDINFRSLFQRMTDKRLSAMSARLLGNYSILACASECVRETAFQCKSFDFDNRRRACILYKVNLDDRDIHFIPTPGVDHYKTNYQKLYDRIPNHMLSRSHNRRVDAVTVEECARRCMLEIYFKCRGFDYETLGRTCWLTERTPQDTGGINIQQGWDYYQRKPEGPLMRFINYGYGRLKPLQSAEVYQKVVMGVPLDYCATLCLAETHSSFHCLSFDFVFSGGDQDTCHLSKYIGANVYGLVSSTDQRVMHFEKKERYLAFFYATPYSVILGNNQRTYTHVTPNRCARMCMQEEGFVCRSFDYRIEKGTCLLSTKTGSDVGGLYNQGLEEVHHFEMKPIMDCGGNLTTSQGNIASPNWPRSYAPNEQCVWQITVPKHKVILFQFTHLDLGLKYHNPCSEREDRVVITEMGRSGRHEICVLPNTKTYKTSDHVAQVTFFSNDEIDGQGFRAFYTAEWTCDVHLSSAPGELASPSWPASYPPSTRCSWRITAPPRHRVSLRLTHFSLEQHLLGHCNTQFDHLTILDGGTVKSPRIGLYCGRHAAFTVRSSGRDMFVQFISDATDARPGFHATYDFEFANGTVDADLDFRDDEIEALDGTAVLEGEPGGGDDNVLGDPSADKHMQTDDSPHIAGSTKLHGGSDKDRTSDSTRSTLWAVLTTMLFVLIALIVILFLVWRHYRGKLTKQRQIVTDETPAEEVPLQEPCSTKPNNEDYNAPSTSHNATQFTNLLYGDAEKKVHIKNINLDTKC